MRGHLVRFAVAVATILALAGSAVAADKSVERGRYLVELGGCVHCHTPGYFLGKPDMARRLGGSDVGFYVPDLGTFYGPNLTPDKETGLGRWTTNEIVIALTTGKRPDGRELAPIMPWRSFAELSKNDARAIALYLKSLPPVSHRAPGPFGPNETPTSFAMKVGARRGRAREIGWAFAHIWVPLPTCRTNCIRICLYPQLSMSWEA